MATLTASGGRGVRWFIALRDAISSPATPPTRCPTSPESSDSPVDVRQLLYGRKPHVYRILFTIKRDGEQILDIRHGRRRETVETVASEYQLTIEQVRAALAYAAHVAAHCP